MRARRLIGGLVLAVVLAVGLARADASRRGEGPVIDYARAAQGAVQARSVYWVGHSLLSQRDPRSADRRSLVETVAVFAQSRGQTLSSYEQTASGSPLSLAYRGAVHAYARTDAAHAAKKRELEERGARYDAMVLTDTVPIESAMRFEHSAWYATRFACDLRAKNPAARVYLYESWVHLHGSAEEPSYGSPAAWRFVDRLRTEHAAYARLQDQVNAGDVAEPGWRGKIGRAFGAKPPCVLDAPVLLIPVGSAMAALADAMARKPIAFAGRSLALADLFANAITSTPSDWPRADVDTATARARLQTLPRRDPGEPLDDIHASVVGIYFASLVHYAVLFGQSPEGLPPLDSGLEGEALREVQRLVWQVVTSEPRTGVAQLSLPRP